MPNNNDLVNRPFADLQERLDNVQRQERSDVETINRKDMYRAIATYLDSEIYHLILNTCLLYTSPSPRDVEESRMPSSA